MCNVERDFPPRLIRSFYSSHYSLTKFVILILEVAVLIFVENGTGYTEVSLLSAQHLDYLQIPFSLACQSSSQMKVLVRHSK